MTAMPVSKTRNDDTDRSERATRDVAEERGLWESFLGDLGLSGLGYERRMPKVPAVAHGKGENLTAQVARERARDIAWRATAGALAESAEKTENLSIQAARESAINFKNEVERGVSLFAKRDRTGTLPSTGNMTTDSQNEKLVKLAELAKEGGYNELQMQDVNPEAEESIKQGDIYRPGKIVREQDPLKEKDIQQADAAALAQLKQSGSKLLSPEFRELTISRESNESGHSSIATAPVRSGHFAIGRFQMTPDALVEAGFLKRTDGEYRWTGKMGVYTVIDYLDNHLAQEQSGVNYYEVLEKRAKNSKWLGVRIAGKEADFVVTVSGLTAAFFRSGEGNVNKYFAQIEKYDNNSKAAINNKNEKLAPLYLASETALRTFANIPIWKNEP